MSRPAAMGLGAAAAAAVAAGLAFALLQSAEPPAPPPPVAPPAPLPVPTPAPQAGPAPIRSATELRDQAQSELEASLDAFLGAVPVKLPPRPSDVLKQAQANRGLDVRDYRVALEKAIRDHQASAEAARLLVEQMAQEDPRLRFQHALAVAGRLDDAGARVLLEGLRTGPAEVRPDLVTGLRGSANPEVNAALIDLYATDADEEVRSRAALAIAERGDRLPPMLLERARERARDDMRAAEGDGVAAAADVLGTPPLSDDDRRLLIGLLRGPGGDPARRAAALRALASAQVPPAELAPALQAVLEDPAAGAELQGMAQAVLQALAGGGGEPPR